jgi:hypothetical protein
MSSPTVAALLALLMPQVAEDAPAIVAMVRCAYRDCHDR